MNFSHIYIFLLLNGAPRPFTRIVDAHFVVLGVCVCVPQQASSSPSLGGEKENWGKKSLPL